MALVPTLFLDIDGTLSPLPPVEPSPDLLPIGGRGLLGQMLYRPDVIDRLRAMLTGGALKIEWLTTWEEEANEVSEQIGFGPFRSHRKRDVPVGLGGDDRTWWKEEVVRQHARKGLPYVWADDSIATTTDPAEMGADQVLEAQFPGLGLCLVPDKTVGLRIADVVLVESFMQSLR